MARLLIRAGDAQGRKAGEGRKCYQPGDVVAAKPDGWQWGRAEIGDPIFLALDVPGMEAVEAERYAARVEPDPAGGFAGYPSAYTVDIAKLKLGLRTPGGTYVCTKVRFLKAISRKDVPASPFVIRG